jgi:hypothetical protein
MTGWDQHLSEALDHFDVPAPRASLADDIVAKAEASAPVSAAPWPASRRDRRSPWARRMVLGVAAFSLSAAAAATGWLGEPVRQLPVISSIATVIPKAVQARPITKPKPQPVAAVKPKPKPAPISVPKPVTKPEPAAPTVQPVTEAAPPVNPIKKERIEAAAARIEQRLNERDARRAERGLPSNTAEQRVMLEKFKAAQTPAERKAVRAEFEARRAARIEQRRARIETRRDQMRADGALDRPLRARRNCEDIPPGRWIPPRCRLPAARPADQPADLPAEQPDKLIAE